MSKHHFHAKTIYRVPLAKGIGLRTTSLQFSSSGKIAITGIGYCWNNLAGDPDPAMGGNRAMHCPGITPGVGRQYSERAPGQARIA